ncbi:Peptidoglycan/LPS O-acetylase OafA/YrhL, contains acyltransferase and SGNH-hydrolase domains [Bradyrhizobium erythrophlei]|nr:Peptidoglycan/LPS O-acetylase OafA/YrhL, contains acyltransferase and SGNH-hydrolase domains [Bradyrhizobium erythrophlei]
MLKALEPAARADSQFQASHEHESDDYPLFDWLRFALASVVALGHVHLITWSAITGNLAVQVFFALSGWLIGGILLKTEVYQLPRFFFNRATRIWAPYFFSVVTIYALSAAREPITSRWLEFLFYDVTFTHNWFTLWPNATLALAEMPLKGTGNGLWSIAVEEQFYLIAPLLIVMVRFGRNTWLWALIATGLWYLQLTDFASISLGVLASTVQQTHRGLHLKPYLVAAAAGALVISAIVLAAVSYKYGAPLFAISVVLLCARPGHRNTAGVFVGAISYPMYLNHWMGAFLINEIAKRVEWLTPPTIGVLSYVLGIAAGTAAYWMIDRTVLTKRNAFYSSPIGKLLATAAYSLVSLGLLGGLFIQHWK